MFNSYRKLVETVSLLTSLFNYYSNFHMFTFPYSNSTANSANFIVLSLLIIQVFIFNALVHLFNA
jgi:hypothetical protein